jgi:hypothetical protein
VNSAGGPVSPSNRRETGSLSETSVVGLDRFSISFPVERWEPDPTAWDSIVVRNQGTPAAAESRSANVRDGSINVYVGVLEVPNSAVRWWGKVEANPARMAEPSGHGLAPIELLRPCLADATQLARHLVEPGCLMGEAHLKRLDVARDFVGVLDIPALLVGLQAVPRPWAGRTGSFRNGSKNGTQTLDVGSGAGRVRLYDKHAETKGAVSEGTLRWECEARAGWLKRYAQLATVADVNRERVEVLAQDRWEWSGMGHEVMGNAEAVARVWATKEVPLGAGGALVPFTEALRNSFLGWLLAASCGRDGTSSKATRAKYRRLARELGIVISPEMFEAEKAGFTLQLDFESGTQLVKAKSAA